MLLLLDLDNTLIDRDSAFRESVRKFLRGHDLPMTDAETIMTIDASGSTPRLAVARMLFARYPNILPSTIHSLLDKGGSDIVKLPRETHDALCMVRRRGWKCVIVSNGTTVQQGAKIQNSGLDAVVDGWVISESVGYKKPAPEIFHSAARLAAETLSGAWMVGDSPEADIGGANAVGMQSVWVSHGADWLDPSLHPSRIAVDAASAINIVASSSP